MLTPGGRSCGTAHTVVRSSRTMQGREEKREEAEQQSMARQSSPRRSSRCSEKVNVACGAVLLTNQQVSSWKNQEEDRHHFTCNTRTGINNKRGRGMITGQGRPASV